MAKENNLFNLMINIYTHPNIIHLKLQHIHFTLKLTASIMAR